MEKTQEQRRLSAFTGLRAIAAYFVLLFHYGSSFASSIGVPRPLGKILSNGYLGISFFFVLSGSYSPAIIADRWRHGRPGRHSFWRGSHVYTQCTSWRFWQATLSEAGTSSRCR
jgi:peptidoglycan/LPS O-acetylase OafA/YrhL